MTSLVFLRYYTTLPSEGLEVTWHYIYLSVEGKITFASEKRSGWEYTLFEVRGIVKKYVQSTAPLKFWYGGGVGIAPISALYTYFDWSEWRTKTEKGAGIFFVLSGNAGYKWLLGENFTIELVLGIAYYGGNIIIAGENIPFGGLIPDGRFSLGYAF